MKGLLLDKHPWKILLLRSHWATGWWVMRFIIAVSKERGNCYMWIERWRVCLETAKHLGGVRTCFIELGIRQGAFESETQRAYRYLSMFGSWCHAIVIKLSAGDWITIEGASKCHR